MIIYWANEHTATENILECREKYLLQNKTFVVLWQDQWLHKQAIIRSRIENMLGLSKRIFARKTTVQQIDNEVARSFLELNHLQGWVRGKYNYGLYHNQSLYAVAAFSGGIVMPSYTATHKSYELLRFATLLQYSVTGGLHKLLQYFIKHKSPSDIMTYTDLAWGQGLAFHKLGFGYIEQLEPQLNYLHTSTLQRFSKHQAKGKDQLAPVWNIGSHKLKLFLENQQRN
jgi:hypothetical protein